MAPSHRMLPIVGLLLLIAGLLTACGGSSSSGQAQESPAGYPRTIDNCGKRITIEAPPERAVSLDQGSTEILLSLGLTDRMVGTAKWTDPVLKELEAANATVPRLADNAPSFERVLTEELIAEVYNVRAIVTPDGPDGRPSVRFLPHGHSPGHTTALRS